MLGGDIVGVANGDPMDFAYEQKPEEYEYFYIRAFETEYGHYPIPPKQGNSYMYSPYRAEHKVVLTHEKTPDRFEDDYREVAGKIPARRVHAPRTFTFTNRCDLRTDFAYLEFERLHGSATVYLDGEKIGTNITSTSKDNRPFRFYKEISAGYHEIKVVSTLEDGTAGGMSGYVRFGKVVNKNNWSVDLYGGKARVFVKYKDSYALHTKFHEA